MRGDALTGFPKSTFRGIRVGNSAFAGSEETTRAIEPKRIAMRDMRGFLLEKCSPLPGLEPRKRGTGDGGLLQQLFQIALDGVGPDLIALRRQMQVVVHDLLIQRAVLCEELLADVLVEDRLAVVHLGDDGVGILYLLADRSVRLGIAREDP